MNQYFVNHSQSVPSFATDIGDLTPRERDGRQRQEVRQHSRRFICTSISLYYLLSPFMLLTTRQSFFASRLVRLGQIRRWSTGAAGEEDAVAVAAGDVAARAAAAASSHGDAKTQRTAAVVAVAAAAVGTAASACDVAGPEPGFAASGGGKSGKKRRV